MDWTCAANGQQFPPTSYTDVNTGKKMQERQTYRNRAQDSGERVNDDGLMFLGRGRAGGDKQEFEYMYCFSGVSSSYEA